MTDRSRLASPWPRLAVALPALLLAALVAVVPTALVFAATGLLAAGVASAQPEETTTRFLDLSINSITPSVGSTTDNRVSVTGTVSNVGDRRVSDISVRLQRGPELTATEELRSSLERDQSTFDVTGPFIDISASLAPGESSTFTLTLPLFADATSTTQSLAITDPGLYPMVVNVNGTPDFGGPARLDDARFLLPVTSTPDAVEQSRTATPTTLLWPIAAPSSLVGGTPGSGDEVTLTSDNLAASLASGGRLDGLVTALSGALDAEAGRGDTRPLAESVCLAIDPDLLVTVVNMTRGYRVLEDPNNPAGGTTAGVGAAAATSWLDRLQSLAVDRCVLALPFGQTNLDRVAAAGNDELLHSALRTPVEVIDSELDVTSRDVVWPTDGTLDATGATAVAAERPDAGLILAADTTTAPVTGLGPIASYDRVLSTTLADMGVTPLAPADPAAIVTPASVAARTQNAVAAMYWHLFTETPTRSQVIAPPQVWEPDSAGAAALLSALSDQFADNDLDPRSLDDALATAPTPQVGTNSAPVGGGTTNGATQDGTSIPDGTETGETETGETDADGPDTAVGRVAQIGARISDLRSALSNDTQAPPGPDQFVAPLWEDLVRSLSTSRDAGAQDTEEPTEGDRRIDAVTTALDTIVDSVSVVAPGGVFTLASEQSPMLLVARNDLPVPIVVALRFDTPDGITLGDIGLQQLPARGSRSLQVPAQIADSRSLQVEVSVTTPSGTALGEASTVTVRSSAYGTAFTVITAIAGGVLLLLVGRRLWRRFRGTPDPGDRS